MDVALYSGAGLLSGIAVPLMWIVRGNMEAVGTETDWSPATAWRKDPLKLGATAIAAGLSSAAFARLRLANKRLNQLGIKSN